MIAVHPRTGVVWIDKAHRAAIHADQVIWNHRDYVGTSLLICKFNIRTA